MIKWLSKHVKKIELTVHGVGIGVEFRDEPEVWAATPNSTPPVPFVPPSSSDGHSETSAKRSNGETLIRVVAGKAWRRDVPREMDLMVQGNEILLHIHNSGGSRTKYWLVRQTLQEYLDRWTSSGRSQRVLVPARTARKKAEVGFAMLESGDVEVQEQWYMRVSFEDFKIAMHEIGISI